MRRQCEQDAKEAEHQAQLAVAAGHEEVLSVRRQYDELVGEMGHITRDRDLVLAQVAREKAAWGEERQVSNDPLARWQIQGC